jgi:quinol monooxygenase YgiN
VWAFAGGSTVEDCLHAGRSSTRAALFDLSALRYVNGDSDTALYFPETVLSLLPTGFKKVKRREDAMSDFFLGIVFYAKEGQEAALRMDLQAVVAASRKDEGNKRYDLFADQGDARRFVLFEQWIDEAAQQRHLQQEHVKAFGTNGRTKIEKMEHMYKLTQVA